MILRLPTIFFLWYHFEYYDSLSLHLSMGWNFGRVYLLVLVLKFVVYLVFIEVYIYTFMTLI